MSEINNNQGACPDCGTELTLVKGRRAGKRFAYCWKCESASSPARVQKPCPYCGIPNDPPPDSLFARISEQHNRCRICCDVVSNSTEARDAHLSEKGCHV